MKQPAQVTIQKLIFNQWHIHYFSCKTVIASPIWYPKLHNVIQDVMVCTWVWPSEGQLQIYSWRYEVLKPMPMKIHIFWDVMPCWLVNSQLFTSWHTLTNQQTWNFKWYFHFLCLLHTNSADTHSACSMYVRWYKWLLQWSLWRQNEKYNKEYHRTWKSDKKKSNMGGMTVIDKSGGEMSKMLTEPQQLNVWRVHQYSKDTEMKRFRCMLLDMYVSAWKMWRWKY
jgi:hypothetical protein